jgi:uncharacterized protein YqeY
MRLRDKISEDLMAAMKSKEAERLSVIRMMKAAIRNKEIDSRKELEDAEAVQVLISLIKQRKDSVEQFTKGGRLDLANKEAAEIKVIEEYLPAAVSDEEIGSIVDSVITETGAVSVKDMGKVMKACMARFSGRPVDGAKVSEVVKAKLVSSV